MIKSFIKKIAKLIYFFLQVVLISVLFIYLTENQFILKGIKETYLKGFNTANIEDWKGFNNNFISKSKSPKDFEKDKDYNKISLTRDLEKKLEKDNSLSFILIKNNKLLFEKYWDKADRKSLSNSFSMAKTVVTLLVGFAIEEGYIKSLEQPILDFLPEYKGLKFSHKIKILDLAQMTSGLNWIENYKNPINSTAARAYYGDNLEKLLFSLDFIKEPRNEFKYLSGDTQLLTIILRRATGKTLATYLQEKLWQPLGMSSPALWGLDRKNGVEKGFCCLYSNALDFAKLGQFLLQEGYWNERQLLSRKFINKMISPNPFTKEFGQGIWMDLEYKTPFFGFVGHQGQYIIILPDEKIILVRLGKKNDNTKRKGKEHLREEMYFYVNEALKSIQS